MAMSAATNILYHGFPDGIAEPVELRAGPLTLCFDQGDLRHICYGAYEVVQRIYVAVRDQNWGTVPMVVQDLQILRGADSFQISYTAEHRQGAIDFRWQARIQGDARGSIRFSMDGLARTTFLRNRIGFCVLHPIRECAGADCLIEHTDGRVEVSRFPEQIAPHQPFLDVRALRHTVVAGCIAEVRCTGDTFETEDQRNWSDASFKTYCTPLALPFPAEVSAGTAIRQEIVLTLETPAGAVYPAADQPGPVVIQLDPEAKDAALDPPSVGPLPSIGLSLPGRGPLITAREVARLQALHLQHLRVDLVLSEPNYPFALHRSVLDSDAIGAPLDVALFVSDNAAAELRRFRQQLEQVRPQVRTWLIFACNARVTPPGLTALARAALADYDPQALFGSGTNYYFTEFNRARPTPDEGDLICYSLNPQVHAFDLRSLVENLAAQPAMLASARALAGGKPVHVGPVTLRPRANPDATAPDVGQAGQLPRGVDPRQLSLFGAAWTLGSLKRLAEGGAASVTLYETIGWRGVLETAAGSPMPVQFRSIPGSVFPLYHVLADIGEFAGGRLSSVAISDRSRVEALAMRRGGRLRVLLANLTPRRQSVRLHGIAADMQIRRLDETTAAVAMCEPEAFRTAATETCGAEGGVADLDLAPFAVLCLDPAV